MQLLRSRYTADYRPKFIRLFRIVKIYDDIFYPFEYPKSWVYLGILWNEAYLLRALLMNNDSLRIIFFNNYLATFCFDDIERIIPLGLKNTGGSIYLERI